MNPDLRQRTMRLAVTATLFALFSLGPINDAMARLSFTVNSTADVADVNPGNGICETAPGNGVCTLRAAIQEANAQPGADAIVLPAGNYVLAGGAGLFITDSVTIFGTGSATTVINGNGGLPGQSVINNLTASTVFIQAVTIRNGQGGIVNQGTLALINCVVTQHAGRGIVNGPGSMTMLNTTVSNNNSPSNIGGGIYNYGVALITNSTISGNSAPRGAGIANDLTGTLALVNSTVSGNVAVEIGGGIYAIGDSVTNLFNVTVAENRANNSPLGTTTWRGGGLANASTGAMTLRNSIFALNVSASFPTGLPGSQLEDNCFGMLTSAGNNIRGTTSPSFMSADPCTVSGSVLEVDPAVFDVTFGPLQINSGFTATHALHPGNPAIHAGNPTGCTNSVGAALMTDQRGAIRPAPASAACDAGAYQFQATVTRVDLNGDGDGDAFVYEPTTGFWGRQLSQSGGGISGTGGGWAPGWSVQPAHFNSDGRTDFFVFSTTNGQWFKMITDGAGFTAQSTGGWWPGWQRHVMDLDGDGIADLFLYDPATGQWFKCISTPTGFIYHGGGWAPDWELYPLQLNGDGLEDLFLLNRTTGQWVWVVSEIGAGFAYPLWGAWSPVWKIYPGDFNGDGLSDLLLHNPTNAQYFIVTNTGAGFTYEFGAWSLGWTPYVVDLDGDRKADLFMYNTDGMWFHLLSDGFGHFTGVGAGFWATSWEIYPTDFNADGRTDVLLYNRGTGEYFQALTINLGNYAYFQGGWIPGLTIFVGSPVR